MGLKSHFFIIKIWSCRLKFFQKLIFFPCQVIRVIPQSQRKKTGINDFQGNPHFLGQGCQKGKIRVQNGLQKSKKPFSYVKNIPNNSFLAQKHIPKNFIPQTFKIALSAVLKYSISCQIVPIFFQDKKNHQYFSIMPSIFTILILPSK